MYRAGCGELPLLLYFQHMHITDGQKGFTVVEILVVIVVIAVLATLSVTVYAGVQTRATNSQILQVVANWERVLKSYKAVKGAFPLSDYNCLANDATNFPAGNGLAAGECMHGYPGAPTFSAVYSNALTSDLRSVLTNYVSIPSGKTSTITGVNGGSATPVAAQGVRYANQDLEYYILGKSADCGRGTPAVSSSTDTLTRCYIDLDAQ